MGILSVLDREHTVAPPGYSRCGVLAVGFVANLLIRQVSDRFHEKSESTLEAAQ